MNTNKVTTMQHMFSNCYNIDEIGNLNNWNADLVQVRWQCFLIVHT